jgi:hypothetical protein
LLNTSNVFMSGTGTQVISGSSPTTFEFLQVIGGSGITTVNQDIVINQVLYVETGNTLNGGTNEVRLMAPGDPFILEGSFVSGTGTVNYAAADVTNILPINYYNLKSEGVAIKSLMNNTTVSNELNLDGTLLDAATYTLSIGNSPVTANSGALKVDAGTLELTNASDLTIPSGMIDGNTFNHLTLLGAGGATLSDNATLNGDLTLTAGSLNLGSSILTMETNATMSRTSGLINTGTGGLIFKAATLDASAITTGTIHQLEIDRAGDIVEINNGNLNVTNTFTLTDGTLDINTNELKLSGGITHNGGAIDADAGIVDFNNTAAYTLSNGLFTGNVHGLKVSGAGGLTLSDPIKVTNALTMAGGNVTTATASLLEIGTSTSTVGSIIWNAGTVVGPMKRWFGTAANSTQASGIFPVGLSDQNRLAIINFTQTTDGGYILMEYKTGLPSNDSPTNPFGLPLSYVYNGQTKFIQNADLTGYWDITPYSTAGDAYAALDNNTFDITLRINSDVIQNNPVTVNPPGMRIIRAKGNPNAPHDEFQIGAPIATFSQVEGSNPGTDFYVRSNGLTGFSWFNIGGDNSTPLPIELLSFTGFCKDNQTTINWKTASEFNSSYYIVEKSMDGQNWREVNTQAAAGISTEELSYQFVDESKNEDNAYYRLTQFDIDGEFTVYDPIFVGCYENESFIKTYPNPSDASFQVLVNNESLVGKATIKIVDTRGTVVSVKEVQVEEGTNLFYLNENMAPGIYYISISNGSVSTEVVKHSVK